MKSAIYRGWVSHVRKEPVEHCFRYRHAMLYLDLDELESVFRGAWLWSAGRPAPAWFRRSDYLEPHGDPLARVARRRAGLATEGPVRLLTTVRMLGLSFNPVSFYYCFAPDGEQLESVVAEITNTPWGERHSYVVPGDEVARFDKSFHVSPFMAMEQSYRWRINTPEEHLMVHMENHEQGDRVFAATLTMERAALSPAGLRRLFLSQPLLPARVLAAIYWQAFCLRMKAVPFHAHPGRTPDRAVRRGGSQ